MDAKVKRRVRPALLAGIILLGPAGVPLAAAATPPISSAPVSSEAPAMWPPSPELLAQGAGAVIGFGAFSLFVAPEAAAAGGVAGLLGGRVMAAALAGMGAVAGTYAYDPKSGSWLIASVGRIVGTVWDGANCCGAFASPCG
jgi:hypothetical protein